MAWGDAIGRDAHGYAVDLGDHFGERDERGEIGRFNLGAYVGGVIVTASDRVQRVMVVKDRAGVAVGGAAYVGYDDGLAEVTGAFGCAGFDEIGDLRHLIG